MKALQALLGVARLGARTGPSPADDEMRMKRARSRRRSAISTSSGVGLGLPGPKNGFGMKNGTGF